MHDEKDAFIDVHIKINNGMIKLYLLMFTKLYNAKVKTRHWKKTIFWPKKNLPKRWKFSKSMSRRNNYGHRCNLKGQTSRYLIFSQPQQNTYIGPTHINKTLYLPRLGKVYNHIITPTKHQFLYNATTQYKTTNINYIELSKLKNRTQISNICLPTRKISTFVKAPGTTALILRHNIKSTLIRLPSKKLKLLPLNATAQQGSNLNSNWRTRIYGKAGTMRAIGKHPSVRLMAKNCNAKKIQKFKKTKKLKQWRKSL